ncbi:Tail length tape measure protein [Ceratobasidium sp. AG-Ba]|nr:Tail length tape measure protein [Ceratobasidium sp. AG-Ba]
MPGPDFRKVEISFLRQYIDEWVALKRSSRANGLSATEKTKARNRLVHRVIHDFFQKFPERNLLKVDKNDFRFTEDQKDRFFAKLKEWFKNNTREKGGREVKQLRRIKKKITARILISKKCTKDIGVIAQRIRAEDPSLNRITARNHAVTQFIEVMKTESPAEYEGYQELARKLRTAAQVDYADQSVEALNEMLQMFPNTLYHQVLAWSESMPVHLYCLAAYSMPGSQKLNRVLSVSPSCDAIEQSEESLQIINLFAKWLEDQFGKRRLGDPEVAEPAVHPDAGGNCRPMLPVVDSIKETRLSTLRDWLRVFFNYLWKWQGGHGQTPWKRFSEDRAYAYIDKKRMPVGILFLIDPHDMTRSAVERWYSHLLKGQAGELAEELIFQFQRVDRGPDNQPLTFSTFCRQPDAASALKYAPEEKLYALRVSRGATTAAEKASWRGLPLARSFDFYCPLPQGIVNALNQISTPVFPLSSLVSLVQEMESLGAVHTIDISSINSPSALCPLEILDDEIEDYIGGDLLPPAFFNLGHADHDRYALSTLSSWLKGPNQFFHPESASDLEEDYMQFPVTNGVPLAQAELKHAYDRISNSDPDITLGAGNDIELPMTAPDEQRPSKPKLRPRRPAAKMPLHSDSDNTSSDESSHESIEINEDDIDSSDEELLEQSIREIEHDSILKDMTLRANMSSHQSAILDHGSNKELPDCLDKTEHTISADTAQHINLSRPISAASKTLISTMKILGEFSPWTLQIRGSLHLSPLALPIAEIPPATVRRTTRTHTRLPAAQEAIDMLRRGKGSAKSNR